MKEPREDKDLPDRRPRRHGPRPRRLPVLRAVRQGRERRIPRDHRDRRNLRCQRQRPRPHHRQIHPVTTDDRFDITDAEGKITKESSVLKLTVGGEPVYHVGSSLILAEQGLESILNDANAKAEVNSTESSVPFLSRLKTSFDEFFTGKDYTVLIRSQEGTPIAVYSGDKVSSYSAEGIPNSTVLLIDHKRLFIYRCDYTIYSSELIQ